METNKLAQNRNAGGWNERRLGMRAKGQEERQHQITVKNLLKLPVYFIRGIKYHAAGRIYAPKPILATLHITHRCNSRCIMCSIWTRQGEERELTIPEIGAIFRNSIFSSVSTFGLSGGEPTLREELVEIAQTVLDACPQAKEMALFTNGLEPDLVLEKVQGIMALSKCKSLNRFTVSVSLDGYGNIHDKIRRVPQAFERATETIRRLQSLQQNTPLHLCATCVVQPLNVDNLVQLAEFTREIGLPISFVPVRVDCAPPEFSAQDAAPQNSVRLTDEQLRQLEELFCYQLKPVLPLSTVIFWEQYFKIVGGDKRRLPCFLTHHYIDVDIDGTLNMCAPDNDNSLSYGNALDEPADKIWYSERAKETRRRLKKYACPRCDISCNIFFSLREEFFYTARFLLKQKVKSYLASEWGEARDGR